MPLADVSAMLTRQKAAVEPITVPPGAWQRDYRVDRSTALSYPTVFACQTRIANDLSKIWLRVVEWEKATRIWRPTEHPVASAFLRRPNRYQNRMQYVETYGHALMAHGNFYGLKQRGARNEVIAVYPIDPLRVTPLVAPGAAVFYRVNADNLSPVETAIVV
ncbi:MAG: phage portal protein, partial [Parvularculaceae bacterium]|nr:phage portal protein [Parvularculaceae bacterium]